MRPENDNQLVQALGSDEHKTQKDTLYDEGRDWERLKTHLLFPSHFLP